ncbi:hypothetical protein TNCV_3286221, partial [Trichonephila clavipes]
MSRFGGLSEERPSVFKTPSKLGTHLLTQCSGDERQSRPCAAREDKSNDFIKLAHSTCENGTIAVNLKNLLLAHFYDCGDLRFLPVNFDKTWPTTLHLTSVSTYHAKGTTCLLLKKYKCLTISEKQKVIESVEEGERKVDVAKAFEIPLSSLSTILKNKEKIFSASSSR